jgi:hypothetical protein
MAHQDPVDPLSEFDALLRQALSVEPSNRFLPTVRERIRTEPAAAPWSLWRFAPLAAAAALVLAIGAFMWSNTSTTDPSPGPIASAPTFAPRAPEGEPRAAKPPSTSALRSTADKSRAALRRASPEQRTANREPRNAKEPEVIVDERQREALQALMRMINQGQLTQEMFKKTTPPPVDIAEAVTIIGVVPVSVSPIVVGGVLQGEGERK